MAGRMGKVDRSRAGTYSRAAQAGVGVLVLAGVGVAMMGLPKVEEPTDFSLPEVPEVAVARKASGSVIDAQGAAMRLAMVPGAPKPPAPPPPPPTQAQTRTDGEGVQPPTPGPGSGEQLRYLGQASIGPMSAGLVALGTTQRFVRVGQAVEGEEIRTIEPEFMILARDGAERRLDRSSRGMEVVTRVKGAPGGAAGAAKAAAGPNPGAERRINLSAAARAIQPEHGANLKIMDEKAELGFRSEEDRQFYADIKEKLRSTGEFQDDDQLSTKARSMYQELREVEAQRRGGKRP